MEFDVPGSARMRYAVRLCTYLFNDRDEIDRVMGVMGRLADEIS